MDDTIVHGVIINLINIGIMDVTPKTSDAAIVDEVEHNALEPRSK